MAELIKQPFDKYWDGHVTRREIQTVFNKLAANDSELMGMADTAAFVLNFILEVKLKLNSREELDIYVEAKRLQVEEMRAKLKAEQEARENTLNGQVADNV